MWCSLGRTISGRRMPAVTADSSRCVRNSSALRLMPTPHRSRAPLSCARQTIDAGGRVVEQLGLLAGRAARGQTLEGVPQHRVAAARLVHREIRLEHAAIGTELLDGELVIVSGGLGELLAAGRPGPLVPPEAVDLHV